LAQNANKSAEMAVRTHALKLLGYVMLARMENGTEQPGVVRIVAGIVQLEVDVRTTGTVL
jgi:hypothetical protein